MDPATPIRAHVRLPAFLRRSGGAGDRRAAFGFIFVSAVASALSIGIMVPILPNLLKQFTGALLGGGESKLIRTGCPRDAL